MRKRIICRNYVFPITLKRETEKETEFLVEQYRVLSADRISHNQLFWNVQIMCLTAQSFLLILALGGFNKAFWARAIGSFIGLIFSFLSIQGFERNRYMEISDAEALLDIERYFSNQGYRAFEIHDKPPKRKYLCGDYINQNLCTDGISNFFCRSIGYVLWKNGLWTLLITNAYLLIKNLFYYCFNDWSGEFLLYDSIKEFRHSFDNLAIVIILAIIVLNWILSLSEDIMEQQPRYISKYYYSGAIAPSQKKLDYKTLSRAKKVIYSVEALAILIEIVYTAISYFRETHYFYFTWAILFIFCSICSIIPFCIKKKNMKKSKRIE